MLSATKAFALPVFQQGQTAALDRKKFLSQSPSTQLGCFTSLREYGKRFTLSQKLKITNECLISNVFTFLRCVLFLFEREGEEGAKGRGDRNIDQLPLACNPTRNRTRNLGLCPDRESNQQPFIYGKMLQPSEPCRSGPNGYF